MKFINVVIVLLGTISGLIGQNPYSSVFAEKDYDAILEIANQQIIDNPKDSMAFYMKGLALNNKKEYKLALDNLHIANELGFTSGPYKYHLAMAYAGVGKNLKSIEILQEIVEAGMPILKQLDKEPFISLADEPDFKSIRKKLYSQAYPCKVDKRYRKFDFWLGEWDVFVQGQKRAESNITLSNGDCGILEDYQTIGTYSGSSISYFDPMDNIWKQNWVAAGGVSHYFENTEKYEADMEMINSVSDTSGVETLTKMSYIFDKEKDTVTQNLVQSKDNGRSWVSVFSGLYKRRK